MTDLQQKEEIDSQQREALRSLRLGWAPTADDMWHSQGAFHVEGIHDDAMDDVMAAYADAADMKNSNPLGVVVRGPAGSGKTHLLGEVRARVQAAGGYFFLLQLLDATNFWQSGLAGILESLGRPGSSHDTQLEDLLWELSSQAHIPRSDRRAVIGEDDLTPQILSGFVNALDKDHPQMGKQSRHTLRALVLLGATDPRLKDLGEAFLTGTDDLEHDVRTTWGLGLPPQTEQERASGISRVVALAGPAVLAIDQIDTLIAQFSESTTGGAGGSGNRDLEQVAHGLMAAHETMHRTASVVACLPSVWEVIYHHATATVRDRFRTSGVLKGLSSPAIGRAILERRFTASYRAVEFDPPYPSWPILPSAFDDATNITPRRLLQLADAHVRNCLASNSVEELRWFANDTSPEPVGPTERPHIPAELDRQFAEYRQRAVTAAALDPDGEDTTVPSLLSAALQAWITEHGDGQRTLRPDPPPGRVVTLHARLRQTVDAATDDERHWAFRAIATGNPTAAQARIKKACGAAGFSRASDKRQLILLRNTPWPSGPKTAALVSEFDAAGGRTLPLSDDDLRTLTALRDLFHDNHPDLADWLQVRRPAHGIALLREALSDLVPESPHPTSRQTDERIEPEPGPEPTEDLPSEPREPDSATAVPLGVTVDGGQPISVELAALRKHTAIFAGSGSGKTVLIRRLVEECALRGVSSIVLDPNNDLSRLGTGWPQPPAGWLPTDGARAADYLDNTEVVVWTPRRSGGRPLSFQPLPDFTSVVDDEDEFSEAVESAFAALEPKALISGGTPKAHHSRAVLKEALRWYGRQPAPTLAGFIQMLSDLPDDVSGQSGARVLAATLGQNLRAATVIDPMFGGSGTPADPSVLLTPSEGYRARVSVISMIGLPSSEDRQNFVNQLQMALFAWIKRHPAGERPLGGLLVMDEAQNFAPSSGNSACTQSTLALSSQARKYGLGLVFATQSPRGIHNNVPANSTTQFYGLLNSPNQITVAKEMARAKGGQVPDISRLSAGYFYAALEGKAFQKIRTPWCLSYHPASPPTTEEVIELARRDLEAR
jgi:Helicase HerA, central domain